MLFCGRLGGYQRPHHIWELLLRNGLEMEEVNRFPNHLIEAGGHFYWDIYELVPSYY